MKYAPVLAGVLVLAIGLLTGPGVKADACFPARAAAAYREPTSSPPPAAAAPALPPPHPPPPTARAAPHL